MAKTSLPQRTAVQDIEKIIEILSPKVISISISDAKKIDASLFESPNLDACIFLGIIEQEKGKIKLTTSGRNFNNSTKESEKKEIIKERLRQIPIYDRTIEYF